MENIKKCKAGHLLTEENKRANGQCKECAKLYAREYRKRDYVKKYYSDRHKEIKADVRKRQQSDAYKQKAKDYRENNKERLKEVAHRNYIKNKDKYLERNKLWKKNNIERVRHLQSINAKANPDRIRHKNHIRRIRKYTGKYELINYQQIYERDGWVCHICKEPVDKQLKYPDPLSHSLDHIVPLSKGGNHVSSNVALAHLRCNILKSDKKGIYHGMCCDGTN